MLDSLWNFYTTHREAVIGLGGGLVAIIGGGWAVFKFFAEKKDKPAPQSRDVRADRGSVAVGGDAQGPITIDNSRRTDT